MNVREIVLDILLELSQENEYSNVLIAAVLEKYDYLDGREKAFIKRVAAGTVERRIQIDYVLGQFSKVPVEKMKPLIRELLRMSCYQILFMDNIPDAAACNEAVKLAKKRHFQSLQGYVNGVLRAVARGREQIAYPDRQTAYREYLSVCCSMPPWLVAHFCEAYGEERCGTILQAFLQRRAVGIRFQDAVSAEERGRLLTAWQEQGVSAQMSPYLPYAASVENAEGIRSLAGYAEGAFAVQDLSSLLVIEAAGIRAGDTVIDVCASPGGKALHAASRLAGTGEVIACDLTPRKTERIEENMRRLRMANVSVRVRDARVPDEKLIGRADVLIADVPCSGLGVIGRKQDIKYRVTPESIRELLKLQKDILRNAVRYLKPSGTMMYSTCTMDPAENEETVSWLGSECGMEAVSMADDLPAPFREGAERGYVQLLPGIHDTDGFFIAKLRRRGQR